MKFIIPCKLNNRHYNGLAFGRSSYALKEMNSFSLWTFHLIVWGGLKVAGNISWQEEELVSNILSIKSLSLRTNGLSPLIFFLKIFFYSQIARVFNDGHYLWIKIEIYIFPTKNVCMYTPWMSMFVLYFLKYPY